jgi:hypothetical protein
MFKLALRYTLYALSVLLGGQTWYALHSFEANALVSVSLVAHQVCPGALATAYNLGCGIGSN